MSTKPRKMSQRNYTSYLKQTTLNKKKKKKNKNNHMQTMTATLVRHQMNKDTIFSIITGISIGPRMLRRLEKKGVRLLSLSFLSNEDLYYNMRWSGSFYLINIERNRKLDEKHLVQTKPKGKNTISNIMKRICN